MVTVYVDDMRADFGRMTWAEMTTTERLAAIRQGYLAGQSNSTVAKALGTTRSTVIGLAWRNYLSIRTAQNWQEGKLRPHVPQEYRRRRRPITVAQRRAKLRNLGADVRTRRAVAMVNAIPMDDVMLAEHLGVNPVTLSSWRCGRRRISKFLLQCVTDLYERHCG